MFDCEYTVGEKGLTIVTNFWEVGDDVCIFTMGGERTCLFASRARW